MAITPNGVIGLNAVRLVEEVPKHEQGIVPTQRHSTVERTVVNWDQQMRHRNVTQTRVVSFDQLLFYVLTLKFLLKALRTLTMSTKGSFVNCSKLKLVSVN